MYKLIHVGIYHILISFYTTVYWTANNYILREKYQKVFHVFHPKNPRLFRGRF